MYTHSPETHMFPRLEHPNTDHFVNPKESTLAVKSSARFFVSEWMHVAVRNKNIATAAFDAK